MAYKILGEKNRMVQVDFYLKGPEKQHVLETLRAEHPRLSPRQEQTKLIETCLDQYLKQENKSIWRLPHITNVSDKADLFRFQAILTRFPEVTLPSEPIELEVPELQDPDETEIQNYIDNFLLRFQELKPVDRPADWGDLITMGVHGECLDKVIPHSVQSHAPLLLKPPSQGDPDPLMLGILGLSPNDKKRIIFNIPDSYLFPAWRGKKATYTVKVYRVQEVHIPALDTELAQTLGFEDLRALLASLMADLASERKAQWEKQLRQKVLMAYVNRAEVVIPRAWVEESLKQQWLATDLTQFKKLGVPKEYAHKSLASWMNQPHLLAEAQFDLKTKFVLREVLKQQRILLQDSDILKALDPLSRDKPVQQVYEQLAEDGFLEPVKDTLHLEKAVDFIMQQARLKFGDKVYQPH